MRVRRCPRSISFWTKLLGTDNNAKPSAIVNGLTSVNQARCWGVRWDDEESPLTPDGDPLSLSPLSSATTMLQTSAKGESGSSVNDEYPLVVGPMSTNCAIGGCPHSYPQVWTGQPSPSRRRSARVGGRAAQSRDTLSGSDADQAPLLSLSRPFRCETALAEANSFRRCGPTVRQHWRRLLDKSSGGRDGCDGSERRRAIRRWFDRAKMGQYPRTVARKSAIRQRTGNCPGVPRRSASETKSLPTATVSIRVSERTVRRGRRVPGRGETAVAKGKRTYQPNNRRRARVHGFRLRMRTRAGRAVVSNRRRKGRRSLTA